MDLKQQWIKKIITGTCLYNSPWVYPFRREGRRHVLHGTVAPSRRRAAVPEGSGRGLLLDGRGGGEGGGGAGPWRGRGQLCSPLRGSVQGSLHNAHILYAPLFLHFSEGLSLCTFYCILLGPELYPMYPQHIALAYWRVIYGKVQYIPVIHSAKVPVAVSANLMIFLRKTKPKIWKFVSENIWSTQFWWQPHYRYCSVFYSGFNKSDINCW